MKLLGNRDPLLIRAGDEDSTDEGAALSPLERDPSPDQPRGEERENAPAPAPDEPPTRSGQRASGEMAEDRHGDGPVGRGGHEQRIHAVPARQRNPAIGA